MKVEVNINRSRRVIYSKSVAGRSVNGYSNPITGINDRNRLISTGSLDLRCRRKKAAKRRD